MTDAITSKFKLKILITAGETSKIFATTYPVHGLQITQLSFQRYRGVLRLRQIGMDIMQK